MSGWFGCAAVLGHIMSLLAGLQTGRSLGVGGALMWVPRIGRVWVHQRCIVHHPGMAGAAPSDALVLLGGPLKVHLRQGKGRAQVRRRQGQAHELKTHNN